MKDEDCKKDIVGDDESPAHLRFKSEVDPNIKLGKHQLDGLKFVGTDDSTSLKRIRRYMRSLKKRRRRRK